MPRSTPLCSFAASPQRTPTSTSVSSCPPLPQGVQEALRDATQVGGTFRRQVEVVDPALRTLMGLKEGEEAHHDVQVWGGEGCRAGEELLSACPGYSAASHSSSSPSL